jgi:hypothetical protein
LNIICGPSYVSLMVLSIKYGNLHMLWNLSNEITEPKTVVATSSLHEKYNLRPSLCTIPMLAENIAPVLYCTADRNEHLICSTCCNQQVLYNPKMVSQITCCMQVPYKTLCALLTDRFKCQVYLVPAGVFVY